MHAGVPDLPIVTKFHQEGLDVNDGPVRDRAIAELWKQSTKALSGQWLSADTPAELHGSMRNSQGVFPPCAALVAGIHALAAIQRRLS
jgi:hypothetical protein